MSYISIYSYYKQTLPLSDAPDERHSHIRRLDYPSQTQPYKTTEDSVIFLIWGGFR